MDSVNNDGKNMFEKFMGIDPEIRTYIENLHALGLGRAITIGGQIETRGSIEIPDNGESSREFTSKTETVRTPGDFIGYILPVDENLGRLWALFIDGSGIVFSTHMQSSAENYFSPSELPFNNPQAQSIAELKAHILYSFCDRNKGVLQSDDPKETENYKKAIEEALTVAKKLKADKQNAQKENTRSTADRLKDFLAS